MVSQAVVGAGRDTVAETESAESFDEFVRTRSGVLLRSAYLLTSDRHAAEDLLQDVLERVCLRWRRIRHAPEAYVRRVMVNQSISRWRYRWRRPEAPLLAAAEPRVPDHADGLVLRAEVLAALRELPNRQRVAVVLRYLDDLSEADTAAAMGCSAGTVKAHASRGLARLRDRLGTALLDGDPTTGGES